jgi:TRAP-type mannitol/chloroaromatic compound transport system substrate-binding protein
MKEESMKRRTFLKKAGVGAVAGAATLAKAPAVLAQKTYNWKMVTTWPPHFPVLGEGADHLAKWIEEMTDGRIKIHVYGGGELIPALECFDAVSQGTVEMGHGASYYWAGKVPAAQFFAAVPFGFNAQQINSWFYGGGGLDLWREVYAPFNLVPFPAGNTGVQMGGWFRKEINTMDDFKGLKMRIPGLGGKVLAKAGANVINVAGGEIYTNLDRGVIDATEWVGPYHDLKMGFYKAAQYYYYPGWHEPGTCLECFINKKVWDELPKDLQNIIYTALMRENLWTLAEFDAKNGDALKELVDQHGVKLKKFPDVVLKGLMKLSGEVLEEAAAADPATRKVYEAFKAFRAKIEPWTDVSERAYMEALKL